MNDITKEKMGKRASNVALITNTALMISKIIIGISSKSTAIIADAFNNGTDIFASAAVFSGIRVAYRPPDENHHYGHAKAEPIVSKIVGLIVIVTGGTIGYSAVTQIIKPKMDVPSGLAILISAISIFVKYFLYRYTNNIGKAIGSSSLVADSHNHRSDVLASGAVLVGVAGARFGFPILDPIAGLVVSIIIFKTGVSIYIESINALMDTAPSKEVMEDIKHTAFNTDGVLQVNEIKARKHGANYHVDLKICVDKDITVEMGHNIASDTKKNILNDVAGIQDVMVHVNPCSNVGKDGSYNCENCSKLNTVP